MKKKYKPPYSAEFRSQAVTLAETSGQSFNQTAMGLGIDDKTLARWVREAHPDRHPAATSPAEEPAPHATCERRIRTLEMERDILKKAIAFFAKEQW